MRHLAEGLFDKNLIDKEVVLGELYELSDSIHDNVLSNPPGIFDIFILKELKEADKHIKYVDKNHGFIRHYNNLYQNNIVSSAIEIILECPMINFIDSNNVVCQNKFKEYLKPFIYESDFKDLNVSIRRFPSSKNPQEIAITMYDNLMTSRLSALSIGLIRK